MIYSSLGHFLLDRLKMWLTGKLACLVQICMKDTRNSTLARCVWRTRAASRILVCAFVFCICVHAHMQHVKERPEVDSGYHSSGRVHLVLWTRVPHCPRAHHACQAGCPESPWDPPVPAYQQCTHHTHIFTWVLAFELRSSCVHDKHFIDWTISPATNAILEFLVLAFS